MAIFKQSKNGPSVPAAPIEGSARAYPIPRPARNYADAAMEARQHVLDLEAHIHSLQDKLQNSEIRNNLVEEANKMMHEDRAREKAEWEIERTRLKTERDSYYEQFMAQNTSLQISGKVILDAIDAAKEALVKLPRGDAPPLEPPMNELEDRIIDEYRPKGQRKYEDK